jgi:hypothetical protein
MKGILLTLAIPALGCAVACAQTTGTNPLATARVFSFDEMTAKTAPNGSVGRSVFNGTLATGESVAVHETMQPAGTAPNPVHRIQHAEVSRRVTSSSSTTARPSAPQRAASFMSHSGPCIP